LGACEACTHRMMQTWLSTRIRPEQVSPRSGVMRTPLKRHAGEGVFLAGHTGVVNTVAWSRDSKMLISASNDRSARVWCALKSTEQALLVVDRRGRGVCGGGLGGGGVGKGRSVGQSKQEICINNVVCHTRPPLAHMSVPVASLRHLKCHEQASRDGGIGGAGWCMQARGSET